MWTSLHSKWSTNTNSYEKFAVERFIQRCDDYEIISNKHRSINGYIQLKELIKFCVLSFKRGRTIKTVIAILEESKSKHIRQNIVNDIIIDKYFLDLKTFIQNYSNTKLLVNNSQPDLAELKVLLYKLKIFEIQLDKNYFNCIKDDFLNVDLGNTAAFDRTATILSKLIDLGIPYLIFKGYSLSTIKGLLTRWYASEYHISFSKIFNFFAFKEETFSFYHVLDMGIEEVPDMLSLLNEIVPSGVLQKRAAEISNVFCTKFQLEGGEDVITYEYTTFDPHNHVRRFYDNLFKNLIIRKERQSLITFNTFIEKSYWSYCKKANKINKIFLDGDSINVPTRAHTLRSTLTKCLNQTNTPAFDSTTPIPITNIEQLNNAIFYYNLALGSKSIENSLSLLWTSLEAILPYRVTTSDIECIQHWISKSLSIGALARDVYGFSLRLIQQNQANDNYLTNVGTITFADIHTKNGLLQWYKWMSNESIATQHFTTVKTCSELLAFQYSEIGKNISQNNLHYLLERLHASKESIKFQLQRIYIHRNQIVHSGDLINEYSNLWTHLEWYVGKILSYFLLNIYFDKNFNSIEEAALNLESEFDYLNSYCEKNKTKKIVDMPGRISDIIFGNNWQFF